MYIESNVIFTVVFRCCYRFVQPPPHPNTKNADFCFIFIFFRKKYICVSGFLKSAKSIFNVDSVYVKHVEFKGSEKEQCHFNGDGVTGSHGT